MLSRRGVENNPVVILKTPSLGGHVGFMGLNFKNAYTSEQKAFDFIESHLEKPAGPKVA